MRVRDGIVTVDDTDPAYDDALTVRFEVFVEGQDVPAEIEIDDHETEATHFVAYDDGVPVGAARVRLVDGGDDEGATAAKVERVAVRESRRREGWGDRLMDAAEEAARERGATRVVLHAQTEVERFYAQRGYVTTSDVFEEAGIPHVVMELEL